MRAERATKHIANSFFIFFLFFYYGNKNSDIYSLKQSFNTTFYAGICSNLKFI